MKIENFGAINLLISNAEFLGRIEEGKGLNGKMIERQSKVRSEICGDRSNLSFIELPWSDPNL